MNRAKFGSESLFITPFVYGTGKAIKAAATRGKRIEFSDSKLDQFFNKIFSSLRARGAKPQQIFEAKMAEKGATMADTNRAMELVKNIDRQVDKIFPTVKNVFDKSTTERRAQIFKELNDALFSGNIGQKLSKVESDRITKFLQDNKAPEKSIVELIDSLNGARSTFSSLINISSNAPKDVKTLRIVTGKL